MSFFYDLLDAAEKVIYAYAWRAGYAARGADDRRDARRILPFEIDRAPLSEYSARRKRMDAKVLGRAAHINALETVVALAVHQHASASERYARKVLGELIAEHARWTKELEEVQSSTEELPR